jgi:shikimate dehydrogenase
MQMQQFGLIGYPLTHSFSKKYFEDKFSRERMDDATFENFSIENISLLHHILNENSHLKGLAVTIPYKKAVVDFLYKSDAVVKKINACNCIKITDGKLFGFNTDVIGFEKSFVELLQPHHNKALILGTGGAAAAVEYTLQQLNMHYQFVSRKKEVNTITYNELTITLLQQYSVIINTTPVGTYPTIDECPAIPYALLTPQHYLFDLVYNPVETKFLQLGKEQGALIKNGYNMLAIQAEENWKIWNG